MAWPDPPAPPRVHAGVWVMLGFVIGAFGAYAMLGLSSSCLAPRAGDLPHPSLRGR